MLSSPRCTFVSKHFYAYDLENWHGMDRYHFNAIVTDQDATDTYLPTFQACVEQGKASGIMCSCVSRLCERLFSFLARLTCAISHCVCACVHLPASLSGTTL